MRHPLIALKPKECAFIESNNSDKKEKKIIADKMFVDERSENFSVKKQKIKIPGCVDVVLGEHQPIISICLQKHRCVLPTLRKSMQFPSQSEEREEAPLIAGLSNKVRKGRLCTWCPPTPAPGPK